MCAGSQPPCDDRPTGLIDAHLHLWDPGRLSYPWLADAATIAGLHSPETWARQGLAVTRAVVVEADCAPDQALAEVDWLSGLDHPALDILAIVAAAPLHLGEGAKDHLRALRDRPKVRGVRRGLQNAPDGFIGGAAHLAGLEAAVDAGLTIDICARARQLPEVSAALGALFRRRPHACVVLDHLGKPDIAAHGADIESGGWAEDIRRLAAMPGLRAKVSGLVTEDDWTRHRPDVLGRYIRHAIGAFGPERLMFGADWPVVDLASGYSLWLETFETATADFSPSARQAIRGGTALAFYGAA